VGRKNMNLEAVKSIVNSIGSLDVLRPMYEYP
jgi:hypothetical protein